MLPIIKEKKKDELPLSSVLCKANIVVKINISLIFCGGTVTINMFFLNADHS